MHAAEVRHLDGPRTAKKDPPHGTRARYAQLKCRCDECRASNRAYYHQRMALKKAEALSIQATKKRCRQRWRDPETGLRTDRYYKQACPGIGGEPCQTKSHLRKDSTGGVCSNCREFLGKSRIPATKTRWHIFFLAKNGVGLRTLADKAGVACSTLRKLKKMKTRWVHKSVSARILAITPNDKGDSKLVPARETWWRIKQLLEIGYTRIEINHALGNKSQGLQLGKNRVTFHSAEMVRVLYEKAMREHQQDMDLLEACDNCGISHKKPGRVAALKKILPATLKDIRERLNCLYDVAFARLGGYADQKSARNDRTLFRDLKTLGAKSIDGVWTIPTEKP